MENERQMLRHCTATLAYRAGKALRGAPPEFAGFRPEASARTPEQILAHMGDLLDWGLSIAQGRQTWNNSTPLPWDEEVDRFFSALQRFDDFLASEQPLDKPAERLFQGPIADALTHVGQLTIVRRLSGAPIRAENYFVAAIEAGRVGRDQQPPQREFD